MVWMMGHYPDCNSGPPYLVVDDYKKKHNFQVGGFAAYVLFKKSVRVRWLSPSKNRTFTPTFFRSPLRQEIGPCALGITLVRYCWF